MEVTRMMLENAWYEQDVLSHSEMAKCLNAALKDGIYVLNSLVHKISSK
jgi:hypothetical protein